MSFEGNLKGMWSDYKNNFSPIAGIGLLFKVVPYLLLIIVLGFIILNSGVVEPAKDFFKFSEEKDGKTLSSDDKAEFMRLAESLWNQGKGVVFTGILLFMLAWFVSILGYSSIASGSIEKKKFSFKEALNLGMKNYWGFVGIFISYLVLGAVLALGIGGICFLFTKSIEFMLLIDFIGLIVYAYLAVCFSLSMFILTQEKGVFESLILSRRLILERKKFWAIVGYIFLIVLFSYVASLIQGIIFSPLTRLAVNSSAGLEVLVALVISNILVSLIISGIIVYPLSLLLLKNVYFSIRKS